MSNPSDRDNGPKRDDKERAKIGRADTLDGSMQVPQPLPKRRGTFPPEVWDRDDSLVTSAERPGAAQGEPSYGADTIAEADKRLSESRARQILNARFAAAGYALVADTTFQEGSFIVTLDGYDAARKVGYAYVSHSDADVVTDFDEASELAIEQLATDGKAWILLVHDSDVPSEDVLERRVDAFFKQLTRNP